MPYCDFDLTVVITITALVTTLDPHSLESPISHQSISLCDSVLETKEGRYQTLHCDFQQIYKSFTPGMETVCIFASDIKSFYACRLVTALRLKYVRKQFVGPSSAGDHIGATFSVRSIL